MRATCAAQCRIYTLRADDATQQRRGRKVNEEKGSEKKRE